MRRIYGLGGAFGRSQLRVAGSRTATVRAICECGNLFGSRPLLNIQGADPDALEPLELAVMFRRRHGPSFICLHYAPIQRDCTTAFHLCLSARQTAQAKLDAPLRPLRLELGRHWSRLLVIAHYRFTFAEWAAAGFIDTLLRWKMKLEVVHGNEKAIQPGVQA